MAAKSGAESPAAAAPLAAVVDSDWVAVVSSLGAVLVAVEVGMAAAKVATEDKAEVAAVPEGSVGEAKAESTAESTAGKAGATEGARAQESVVEPMEMAVVG